MPGVPPVVDQPPLHPCVTPSTFTPFVYDSAGDPAALVKPVFEAIHSAELDVDCYSLNDVKILPPGFALLSEHDQNGFLHVLCSADFRDLLIDGLPEEYSVVRTDDVSDD